MLFPDVVVQLLFGAASAGTTLPIARLAGIALIALGIACWPDAVTGRAPRRARMAMLAYNALAAVYLGVVAIPGDLRGPLLWPAVVLHAVMTVWLATAREPRAM
jgi:hypothetical protein